MILTLAEAKTQLRLELDFNEHDQHLSNLIGAAQRSIERNYYCKLVSSQDELDSQPAESRACIAGEDIKLAIQMMVAKWYINPTGTSSNSDTPSDLGVEYLLFPLMEHTV